MAKWIFAGCTLLALTLWIFTWHLFRPLLWGFALEGFPITERQLLHLKAETEMAPCLIEFFLQWPSSPEQNQTAPLNETLANIAKAKAHPCLTWEPMYYLDNERHIIPAEKIISGHYDPYLKSMAKALRKWSNPIIIRFAHEMNLETYHWGTATKEEYGPNSPELYIAMFRYVVEFFRQQAVDNVLFAFCPNAESVPNAHWNRPTAYYPGDAYVHILGMDGYNWSGHRNETGKLSPKRSFQQIFSPLFQELKQLSKEKPILVFETAAASSPFRQKWLQKALSTAQTWDLWGIIWFQADKELAWPIRASEVDLSQIQNRTATYTYDKVFEQLASLQTKID